MKRIVLILCGVFIVTPVLAMKKEGPKRIDCPQPEYPVQARALNKSGTVNYMAWVNDKGEVYSVSTTGDEFFLKITTAAIKKCRYEPGNAGVDRGVVTFKAQAE